MQSTPLYYNHAKKIFGETQTAILRTYSDNSGKYDDQPVEISAEHEFSQGPYQDTVGFAVGSNQTIISLHE